MQPKGIVLNFYKSMLFWIGKAVSQFIRQGISIDWNSNKGFIEMDRKDILNLTDELSRAYIRSKIRVDTCIECMVLYVILIL
jgi:hypothetical protein